MHRVVMIPFAAPNKTIALKNINNALRYFILIFYYSSFFGTVAGPLPVVGVFGIDINGHSKAMHAVAAGTIYIAPQKGAANIKQVFFPFGMLIKLL